MKWGLRRKVVDTVFATQGCKAELHAQNVYKHNLVVVAQHLSFQCMEVEMGSSLELADNHTTQAGPGQ